MLGYKLCLDAAVITAGALLAYFARFEAMPPDLYAMQASMVVPLLAVGRVLVLLLAGVYRRSWRYTGMLETAQLGAWHLVISSVLIVARLVGPHFDLGFTPIPLSVIGIEGLIALAGGAAVRSLARVADERSRHGRAQGAAPVRRTLLIGAGRQGCHAAREFRARPDLGYEVVGFVDDDIARKGQVVAGVEVLGPTRELVDICKRTRADQAILTESSVAPQALRTLMELCEQAGVAVHTIPALPDLLARRSSITQIQPLDLSRLLGRAEVGFCSRSWQRVQQACEGRRILVTGAGGSIGSELCRQLAELHPASLVLLDNNENNLFDIDNEIRRLGRDIGKACLADVRREDDLERVFAEHRPHVVFHTAAYKHVPMMEFHPSAAVRNNIMGTRLLSEVARRHGVEQFVMVSTDKAVRPTNVMGATKQVAEQVVLASNRDGGPDYCCVRFGNVLGSRGSVFHTFQQQMARGGPITVTHPDITRFFMTIPEAVRLVIQAMAVSRGGEVFLLEMGEPVLILDLAKQVIAFSGAGEQEIPIVFSGLRPGEKLYEELVYEDEDTQPCEVDGLMVARAAPPRPLVVAQAVRALEQAAALDDDVDVRDRLADFTDRPVISRRAQLKVAT